MSFEMGGAAAPPILTAHGFRLDSERLNTQFQFREPGWTARLQFKRSLTLMPVRFANSYIDRLFAEKDVMGLHHLISLREAERQLPEEFWLYCRLVEWVGSTRSGIWQYYDGLSDEKFERMSQALDRFNLAEIAVRYRFGKSDWNKPDQAASLDKWLDAHEKQIESTAFDLIVSFKDYLSDEGKPSQ